MNLVVPQATSDAQELESASPAEDCSQLFFEIAGMCSLMQSVCTRGTEKFFLHKMWCQLSKIEKA